MNKESNQPVETFGKTMTTCEICGANHEELPDISSGAPFHWADCLAQDPQSLLTSDLCIVEARDYFIRGVIQIPVHGDDGGFGWGVWISQKKENFEEYRNNYDSPDIGSFFGWLSTEIDYFPIGTLSLKTTAHFRGEGLRPRIVVHECEHPLYRQQRDGISVETAWDIVHFYIKKNKQTEPSGPENPIPSGTSDAKASGVPDSRGL